MCMIDFPLLNQNEKTIAAVAELMKVQTNFMETFNFTYERISDYLKASHRN